MKSDLERAFYTQLKLANLADNVKTGYRFDVNRKWEFDFAWVGYELAMEIEGGVYIQGRHTRGAGFEKDIEKYNSAVMSGWRVLRATRKTIDNGLAVREVESMMKLTRKRWKRERAVREYAVNHGFKVRAEDYY